MNTKNKLFLIVVLILLTTFFFKTIPVPVESPEGGLDDEKFIFGGIYWTSGLFQLDVGNYFGILFYSLIFVTLFSAVYIMEFKE